MKQLMMGMLLLLGGCSVSPEAGAGSAAPNFGGDINSANGKAWLAAISAGELWSAKTDNGFNNWVKGSERQILDPVTGDITGFHLTVSGEKSIFLGAPSPTTAFYMMPRYRELTADSGFLEAQVYGVFLSNVTDQNPNDKTFIYPAALKLTAQELAAFRAQAGISGADVGSGNAEQQKRYNALVHRPENYDLTKSPTKTSLGAVTSEPLTIILPNLAP